MTGCPYLIGTFPLNFASACGTGIAWKVGPSSTLPGTAGRESAVTGARVPIKNICLGYVPVSATGTTAGTILVIWQPGLNQRPCATLNTYLMKRGQQKLKVYHFPIYVILEFFHLRDP